MAPRRRILRQAWSPSANVAKPKARRSWADGQRVEAEAGLGDDAERALAAHEELGQVRPGGGAGPVALRAHDAAVGQHDLEADDHVLDLPVAGRVLPRPPAGEPAPDGREVHRLGPVAEGVAVSHLAERRLEVGTEGAGPHVGRERGLVDAHRPSSAVMSRATPPCTGIDPPQTPLRPAAAVTGTTASLQAASTAATCAVEVGRTTAAGRCGTAPSAAQPMASGHQSRPASARASSSVRTVAPLAAMRSRRPGAPRRAAAPRRSCDLCRRARRWGDGRGLVTAGRARRSGAPSGRTP